MSDEISYIVYNFMGIIILKISLLKRMTFYHFVNCLALTYGPHVLTYKFSGLQDYGAFWKCVQVGMVYIFTQLCKMLILATFFPTTDGDYSLLLTVMKCTIDFGDLVGLSFVMRRKGNFSHSLDSGAIKILTIGLGWSMTDIIFSRFVPLFFGARGLQFDWMYILTSLEANVILVHHLTVVLLLWLWWKVTLPHNFRPFVSAMLVLSVYRPIFSILIEKFSKSAISGFTLLAMSSAPTFVMAMLSLLMYIVHNAKIR